MPNAFVVMHGRERPNFLRGRHFGEPQVSSPSPTRRTANPPASFNPPSTPPKANDITSGTNFSGTPVGFKAGPGWDACTGLGSPIGTKLIAVVNPGSSASASKAGKAKGAKKEGRPKTALP
jgi:hypothetical protein